MLRDDRVTAVPPLEAVFESCSSARFRALAPAWQELAETSAEVPFFMGDAWVESWLEVFGEALAPRMFRLARGGRWIGAAIFAERRERRGPVPVRCLHLHTSGETPGEGVCVEYDRVLARAGEEAAVADALADSLAASRADEVVAGGLTESALELLRRALPGWHEEAMWSADPYVDLAVVRAAGGDYRRTALSRSTRTLVGRSLRAYEELGPLSVEIAEDVTAGTAMLEELVGLHQTAWIGRGRGGAFASPRNRAFHAKLVERALPTGGIQLVRVRAGDETVGLLYSFLDRGRVFFYQSGLRYRDENRFRPGLVAHVCAIERALALGLDEYHFLAGDETTPRYKASLSNAERKLAWVQLQRPGLKSSLIRGLRGLKRRLEAKHG